MQPTTLQLENFIDAGLKEDVGPGDFTSLACIPSDRMSKAHLLVKDEGILAGVAFAKFIFNYVEPSAKFEQFLEDGTKVKYGDVAFIVTCNSQTLLKVERLLLNTMQRMSGIASLATQFTDEVKGYDVKILDTRKTTPLLRFIEKWAVAIGGCENYRTGLYDRFMIKDNHIDACGSLEEAINLINVYNEKHHLGLKSTVEVRDLAELDIVLKSGKVDRVMLDNFTNELKVEAVKIVNGALEVEASGGIELTTVKGVAKTGVDYISVGALTHSIMSMDMSLKVIG